MRLRAIVLGCTSASFSIDSQSLTVPRSYGGARIITALEALISQLAELKLRRVQLFAPYAPELLRAEAAVLEAHGVKVTKCIPVTYADEIRYITTQQLYEVFEREYTPDCDGVIFSCTGLYTLGAIATIRESVGTEFPLLSSNGAISSTLNDLYCEYVLGLGRK